MKYLDTLDAWLVYIEQVHHRPVDLELGRVRAVAQRMALSLPATKIVVGGTNGKGSTCAMLDSILRAAGYHVGRYSSPHLLRFNERVQIDGQMASDDELITQFEIVERARASTTLTYFEFTTLAALACFACKHLDVAILEVGLGGRLDAVNIVDADCSVVTTVDLDHVDLLGPSREDIGWEKAHIFRAGQPAICVDPDPPRSLLDYAGRIGARLWRIGQEFSVEGPSDPQVSRQWNYLGKQTDRMALPWPALRGAHQLQNAGGALAALEALQPRLPVDQYAVRRGLAEVQLPGRFQVVPGRPIIVLDVAHNPHAALAFAQALRAHRSSGNPHGATRAVFGMLRDKDVHAVVQALIEQVDHWYLVPTAGARGLAASKLDEVGFAGLATRPRGRHETVAAALQKATEQASSDDRIVVFGSFVIVAEAMRWLERRSG
ncbi:MAG TPA: bifunctional tetrahydrofolate synthase/dihydrofolate synthase [Burkholderiaceae bacterium]|nr:bifunctional tetrahydrofolate synthase/dihydrofolate synthase [Burkholderiaceae bacterium]